MGLQILLQTSVQVYSGKEKISQRFYPATMSNKDRVNPNKDREAYFYTKRKSERIKMAANS